TRDPEQSTLPVCRTLGIGFVAYSPLGRGFLAGAGKDLATDDFRRGMPRWRGEALGRNLSLLEALEGIAQEESCSPWQLALAWLLHRGDDVVPIPGTSKIHRLEENLAAADIRLSGNDLSAIERAVPASAVEGARYDEAGLSLIER